MKVIKIILITLISGILILVACKALNPDENLTIQRVDYTGNELRTDGYYYYFFENNTVVYFLYRNGIILCAHSYPSNDLNFVEKEMVKIYSEIRKQKFGWGVFLICNNTIEYETWNVPISVSMPIIRCKGYIENDTTFCITESYYSDLKKTEYSNEIYHFKQFNNKPDSTNVYIK